MYGPVGVSRRCVGALGDGGVVGSRDGRRTPCRLRVGSQTWVGIVWWASHVEGLADLGVVGGCADNPARFCPGDPVSRGQVATVLATAFGIRPGPSAAGFTDVEGNVHASSIDALAAGRPNSWLWGGAILPRRVCDAGSDGHLR